MHTHIYSYAYMCIWTWKWNGYIFTYYYILCVLCPPSFVSHSQVRRSSFSLAHVRSFALSESQSLTQLPEDRVLTWGVDIDCWHRLLTCEDGVQVFMRRCSYSRGGARIHWLLHRTYHSPHHNPPPLGPDTTTHKPYIPHTTTHNPPPLAVSLPTPLLVTHHH